MLLQDRLVVDRMFLLVHCQNLVIQISDDELLGLDDSSIEVDRCNHRLEDIGHQTVGKFATTGHSLTDGIDLIETETLTLFGEGGGRDHR